MKRLSFLPGCLLLSCLLLTACAADPTRPGVPAELFDDAAFAPPAQPVQPAQIFALTPEMKRYIDTEIAGHGGA